jgi:drug/metabolite transporter (DMT)-like permease
MSGKPPTWKILSAFAALYLIWGTTYLAIAMMVKTIPPYLGAGSRFLAAGTLLYAFLRLRGAPKPTPRQWGWAALAGLLLLVGGNGSIVWAQKTVPSGIASVIVATEPLWIVLVSWLLFRGGRPTLLEGAGILGGFAGMVLLIGPSMLAHGGGIDLFGAGLLVFATISWAFGSMVSRHADLPDSAPMAMSMEMAAGGVTMLLLALPKGDWAQFSLQAVSRASFLGWLYLVVFGSWIGFVAFFFVMRHCRPSRAATYAYVNPVIAVLLGVLVAGEPLAARTLVSAAVILVSVAAVVTFSPKT